MVETRLNELAGVRQLLAGGDALSTTHVAKALVALPQTQLINGYGPTENTVFSTCHPISARDVQRRSIPIGRPIANTRVYILNPHGEPVPPGVPGELFAGGDGVAQGYLNQPALTDERFLPDPFSSESDARMYRTGDQCRWREDGSIEFLGRMDHEIKVRGFRVDPGEIESALAMLPGVAEAAVVVNALPTGEKELLGFVVAANGAALVPAQVREQLAVRLPPHMVPSIFTVVASMPLTANGKIDRRTLAALPREAAAGGAARDRLGPRNDIERRLETLWCSLLRCEHIGMRDDFFALGGHSLLAMRLLHRIQDEFGQSLPLAALLTAPTIERLAVRLGVANTPTEPTVPVAAPGALRGSGHGAPLFFIPGLGGYEFLPAPVARALEGCCPFFDGLQIVGVDRQASPLEDLRAIAADLVHQIRAVKPQGPYALCGYCYGGVVAFEVARQLEQAGETVTALVIWHGYPINNPWPRRSIPAVLRAIRDRIRETTPSQRPRMLWDKAMLALRMLGWKLSDEWNHLLGKPRSLIPHNVFFPEDMDPGVVYANLRARGRYQPAPYRGRVFLLLGETDRLIYECPPLAGWDGVLLGPVEIFKHPVEHMELVVPPAVGYLAAQTAACLTAAHTGLPARATRGFTAVPSAATPVTLTR
jgi:thioesterase domain-containing protein